MSKQETTGRRKATDKRQKELSIWEHYLAKEIGIEFKACLYFFSILFFYSVYRLAVGSYEAEILHMAEMIGFTYIMGYVQVYLLDSFDESEHLKGKEVLYLILCSIGYAGMSLLCRWFDGRVGVSVGFAFYVMLLYVCAFLVYKTKRELDGKLLNDDLKAFQGRQTSEECD